MQNVSTLKNTVDDPQCWAFFQSSLLNWMGWFTCEANNFEGYSTTRVVQYFFNLFFVSHFHHFPVLAASARRTYKYHLNKRYGTRERTFYYGVSTGTVLFLFTIRIHCRMLEILLPFIIIIICLDAGYIHSEIWISILHWFLKFLDKQSQTGNARGLHTSFNI